MKHGMPETWDTLNSFSICCHELTFSGLRIRNRKVRCMLVRATYLPRDLVHRCISTSYIDKTAEASLLEECIVSIATESVRERLRDYVQLDQLF